MECVPKEKWTIPVLYQLKVLHITMGIFDKLSNLFNSVGIRKAMRGSYEKHIHQIVNGVISVPDGTTIHQAALFGALGSRYRVRLKSFSEMGIWVELSPFMLMSEEDAIDALIEYVVYQERPKEANISWLSEIINDVLRKTHPSEDSPVAMASMAVINRVAWYSLLDSDIKNEIEKNASELDNSFVDDDKDFEKELELEDVFGANYCTEKEDDEEEEEEKEKEKEKDSDVEACKQAVKINPDDEAAHLNLGHAYVQADMFDEAIEAYKQAININPDDAGVHWFLGYAYGKSGMHKEAIEPFKQAIRINPDDKEAHLCLGCTYVSLNNRGAALEEYKILKGIDTERANELFNVIYE